MRVRCKVLDGAAMDALSTKVTGFAQEFWGGLWEAWESGGGWRREKTGFPNLLNCTAEF
jgi:hypothetical protein